MNENKIMHKDPTRDQIGVFKKHGDLSNLDNSMQTVIVGFWSENFSI